MTALAQDRNTQQLANVALTSLHCPLAVAKVYGGGLVGINGSGYLEPAAAGSNRNLKIVGVAFEVKDNSAGVAGALSVKVLRGTFKLANGTTTDALTQADEGRLCYALDDQTVVRTPALGARPVAGRVVKVESDGVWVDTTAALDSNGELEMVLVAGGDLSSSQFFIVKQNTSDAVVVAGAGEEALGIVQNAPAAAAMAIVKVLGRSRCICGVGIAQGAIFASGAAGKAKTAARLVQATGASSYGLGRALTGTSNDLDPFEALITHSGTRGTSDA